MKTKQVKFMPLDKNTKESIGWGLATTGAIVAFNLTPGGFFITCFGMGVGALSGFCVSEEVAIPAAECIVESYVTANHTVENFRQRAEEAKPVIETIRQRAEEAKPVLETVRQRAEEARSVIETVRQRAEEAKPVIAMVRAGLTIIIGYGIFQIGSGFFNEKTPESQNLCYEILPSAACSLFGRVTQGIGLSTGMKGMVDAVKHTFSN